jgi:two-component system copper resistance phosphate regulon response regulator CusR
MRLLIIEDNPIIAQSLRQHLKQYYSVDICKRGQDGLVKAQSLEYDTILLDLRLPDISGEEVCRSLRNNNIKTPIIVISGRGEVEAKVNLLGIGANDYLIKPFNLHELRARINVAMRHNTNILTTGKLLFDGLELDPHARTVKRHQKFIKLRRKEFDLLEYLMRNHDRTLTRSMIMEHIWDANENLWANVVDVHIKYLRDKIDRPFNSRLIRTVHGVGYRFTAPNIN